MSIATRELIYNRQQGCCGICGIHMKLDAPPLGTRGQVTKCPSNFMHIDHIKPRVQGGRNSRGNYRGLCSTCNLSRGNRSGERLKSIIVDNFNKMSMTDGDNILSKRDLLKDDLANGLLTREDIVELIKALTSVYDKAFSDLSSLLVVSDMTW